MMSASGNRPASERALPMASRSALAGGASPASGVSSNCGAAVSKGICSRCSNSRRYGEVEPRSNRRGVTLQASLCFDGDFGRWYHRAFMSHQPAHHPVIDGFEFAAAGAVQQGTLPLGGFTRLRDLLASNAGEVAYEVEGLRDARGRPSLRIRVRCTLEVCCQRCLEAMRVEVDEDET